MSSPEGRRREVTGGGGVAAAELRHEEIDKRGEAVRVRVAG